MRYVAQQHPLGCFVAAAAMVFDMTYEEMLSALPMQSFEEMAKTKLNRAGLALFDRVADLARSRNIAFDDAIPPFDCQPDFRYLLVVLTETTGLYHAIAVDEIGHAYDPAGDGTPKHWSAYVPVVGLAFEHKARR